jgi:hypothetical protein
LRLPCLFLFGLSSASAQIEDARFDLIGQPVKAERVVSWVINPCQPHAYLAQHTVQGLFILLCRGDGLTEPRPDEV